MHLYFQSSQTFSLGKGYAPAQTADVQEDLPQHNFDADSNAKQNETKNRKVSSFMQLLGQSTYQPHD